MPDFDIEYLLQFKPYRKWCLKCRALWEDYIWEKVKPDDFMNREYDPKDEDYKWFILDKAGALKCKVCGVKYVDSTHAALFGVTEFLKEMIGTPVDNIANIFVHASRLASICQKMRLEKEEYPPLRALFVALAEARSFIHFVSWGVSPFMIGSLKVVAQRVPVRGIVSGNVGENVICEVKDFMHEAPNLDIIFCESRGFRTSDIPHQKLVVIDGLCAFKGSANLTQTAWRSAAQGMDHVEIVSNIEEVASLHNRLFSPVWGKMSNISETIDMDSWRD
jgi:hypothetical protein